MNLDRATVRRTGSGRLGPLPPAVSVEGPDQVAEPKTIRVSGPKGSFVVVYNPALSGKYKWFFYDADDPSGASDPDTRANTFRSAKAAAGLTEEDKSMDKKRALAAALKDVDAVMKAEGKTGAAGNPKRPVGEAGPVAFKPDAYGEVPVGAKVDFKVRGKSYRVSFRSDADSPDPENTFEIIIDRITMFGRPGVPDMTEPVDTLAGIDTRDADYVNREVAEMLRQKKLAESARLRSPASRIAALRESAPGAEYVVKMSSGRWVVADAPKLGVGVKVKDSDGRWMAISGLVHGSDWEGIAHPDEASARAALGESTLRTPGQRLLVEGTPKKRERVLTQYADHGNVLTTARKTRPALEAGMYEVKDTMEGIFFEKQDINTDDLLRFEDSRYNVVVQEIDRFWKLGEAFKEMGLTHKRGVLLFGPPGTGKSCLLKQVIENAVEADCVALIGSRSMSTVVKGLRQMKEVEPNRPVLVVLEDMDEICSYDEHSVLEMMDGADQMNGVLVLGTTNYPERLPPRVLRSGRFDTKMEVGMLPVQGRLAYFKHKLSKKLGEADINAIAEKTDGFSFAQMRELLASVYVYGYGLDESIQRIKKNLRESSSRKVTEAGLDAALFKSGYLTEARLTVLPRWKNEVLSKHPSARFTRGKGGFSVHAKVGRDVVSTFDETSGRVTWPVKRRLAVPAGGGAADPSV